MLDKLKTASFQYEDFVISYETPEPLCMGGGGGGGAPPPGPKPGGSKGGGSKGGGSGSKGGGGKGGGGKGGGGGPIATISIRS